MVLCFKLVKTTNKRIKANLCNYRIIIPGKSKRSEDAPGAGRFRDDQGQTTRNGQRTRPDPERGRQKNGKEGFIENKTFLGK